MLRGDERGFDPRRRYFIWVSCNDCGDVTVHGERCALIRAGASVTLAFACEQCGRRAAVGVPDDELTSLLAKGFELVHTDPARELFEPHPVAPPWCLDDLLDAHLLLASTDDIVSLALGGNPA